MDVAGKLTEVQGAVREPFKRRTYQACGATRLSTDGAKIDVEPAMPIRGVAFGDEFAVVAELGAAEIDVIFLLPIPQDARLPKGRDRGTEFCGA